MKTFIQFIFTFNLIFISTLSFAQLVGGRANGESSPKEVKASGINAGGFSGDVSLFSGTYNSSYSLGSVSTPTGLSYSVNLNYSSSFSTGDNLPHTSGIPYGEGWSIDMPSISVSMEDYQKFTDSQLHNHNFNGLPDADGGGTTYTKTYTHSEALKEGDLYWYAPTLNIPGVASGRMVYKFMKSGGIPVFVLQQFDKYIEAEYDLGTWKVTLDDGTKYYFEVLYISHRNASNQRTPKAVNNSEVLSNMVLPKSEISTWYIARIQHPYEIDGITFDYHTFGQYDYYKEIGSRDVGAYGVNDFLFGNGVSHGVDSFGNPYYIHNYGGQISLSKAYKEIYLKEVNSGYDKLVFNHESINTSDGNQMMDLDDPTVFRKDSLYSYKVIYEIGEGTGSFNNWHRYHHFKSDEITLNAMFETKMSSTNPYVGSGMPGGSPLTTDNYYVRSDVNSNDDIAFNHSYLESNRIGDNVNFPPGDIYEIKTKIYNPDATNGDGFLNIDINLATGNAFHNMTTSSVPNTNLEQVESNNYNLNRGESIFTTFNQAIKWNTRDRYDNYLTTSNYFLMPNNPTQYQGFHIQVGPGNSDQNFNSGDGYSTNPPSGVYRIDYLGNTTTLDFNKRYMEKSYFSNHFDNVQNNSNGSGDPIPMNFGTGYPWEMMKNFSSAIEPTLFNPSTGKWWSYKAPSGNQHGSGYDNIPTLADENVKLKKVEIIRHTKNPYMLKNVAYYKATNENLDITDTENFGWSIISKSEMTYEIEQVQRSVSTWYNTPAPNPSSSKLLFPVGNNRNLVILKSIKLLPGELPNAFVNSEAPTTFFDYDENNFVNTTGDGGNSVSSNGNGQEPDLQPNSNLVLLTGITDQLGGKTIVNYGETYALSQYIPEYMQNNSTTWQKTTPYAIQVYVTVSSKEIIEDFGTQTPSSIKYDYEFSNFELIKPDFLLNGNFGENPNLKSKAGFGQTKVYQPELETSNRPYIIYKHYTTDNSLQPNAPKDIYWGKVHKVENYDGNGDLISTTESIYDYTLAFEKGIDRDRNVNYLSSTLAESFDYYDYRFPTQVPSGDGITEMREKLAVSISNGGYEGMNFLGVFHPSAITWAENQDDYYQSYFNSYFVKKIREINKVYDLGCEPAIAMQEDGGRVGEVENTVTVIETQTDYEYHEIDYDGFTANEALIEISGISNPNLTERLFMEPSWQLYKKITTSPQYPDAYTEERTYFYYDLINGIHAKYDEIYKAKNGFDVLKGMYKYRIRNIPFEVRNIVKTPNKQAVVKSTYYEYTDDWDYFADYNILSDTVFSPDYPCTSLGGGGTTGGGSYSLPVGCTASVGLYDPEGQGYCLEPNIFPYGEVYCPCETAGGDGGGVMEDVNPLGEPHSYLKAIYSQVKEVSATNQDILKFNVSFEFDFPSTLTSADDVLKTKTILERNHKGLIHQEEDVNGIITQYNYVPITQQYLKYCHPTRLGEIAIDRRIINMNSGLIQSVTVGEGRTDALTTYYTYNKDNTIETITDPNGGVLRYEYDEFARMSAAYHNNDLLSEVAYHQWENDMTQNFEQRTMKNYVETTTHNDLSGTNFTRARAYIDPVGRNALTAAYASFAANKVIISGHIEYDKWNREYKGFKPFKTTVNGNFSGLTYDIASTYASQNSLTGNYPYTEKLYEDNPRSRVLKSSKFGLDINGSRVVANDYCVINGADFATELNLTSAERAAIIPASSSTGNTIPIAIYKFLKTTITDEDGKWVTDYKNSIGQKVATLRNDGTSDVITLFVYDKAGNLTKVINPKKQESHYRYNYLGQLYEEETPDGGKKQLIYNEKGQVVFERDEMGINNDYYRGYHYDNYGRMLKQAKIDIITSTASNDPFFNFLSNPDVNSLLWLNANKNSLLAMPLGSAATPEKAWIYEDNINFTDASFIENGRIYLQNSLTNYKGQVTQTISYNLFGEPIEYKFFSYNDRGQLKWELAQFNNNGITSTDKGLLSRIDYPKYNLRGSVQTMNVDLDGDRDLDLQYHYTYDQWNRLDEVFVSYDGQEANGIRVAKYYYDDALGHVTKVEYYDEEGNCTSKVDETSYTYDIRDRLTRINSYLFQWNLFYDNNNPNNFITAGQSWNGNIRASRGVYKFHSGNPRTIVNKSNASNFNGYAQSRYSYTYDNLNRLTNADANHTGISFNGTANQLGDATYEFDKIGNLTKLTRKELNPSNSLTMADYRYAYQTNNNRLLQINVPVNPGSSSLTTDRTYTYDDNGNLLSDTKRGMLNTVYGRANLPWNINLSPSSTVGTSGSSINIGVDYLYDVNDSRIFKTKLTSSQNTEEGGTVDIAEYYLKSSSGQDLGIYDFNRSELTWYVFGKERIAKFKHQYEEALNKVPRNDVGFIEEGDLERALAATTYHNQLTGELELNLPDDLLLIQLSNGQTTYVLQSQLSIIEDDYVILSSYTITEGSNQFAFTMTDGTIRMFSLEEVLGTLGLVANTFTIGSGDPFDIPLTLPTTVNEPDFHYYIYDHLGNTRIVYSTELVDCGSEGGVTVEYTLEAVMDYFPYGKILREYIKTTERYVTTGHERDAETGLDYRGARFYDADVARFLSLDPLAAEFPAWSDYNYVLGNPVMLVDPDGRAPEPPTKTTQIRQIFRFDKTVDGVKMKTGTDIITKTETYTSDNITTTLVTRLTISAKGEISDATKYGFTIARGADFQYSETEKLTITKENLEVDLKEVAQDVQSYKAQKGQSPLQTKAFNINLSIAIGSTVAMGSVMAPIKAVKYGQHAYKLTKIGKLTPAAVTATVSGLTDPVSPEMLHTTHKYEKEKVSDNEE